MTALALTLHTPARLSCTPLRRSRRPLATVRRQPVCVPPGRGNPSCTVPTHASRTRTACCGQYRRRQRLHRFVLSVGISRGGATCIC